MSAYQEGGRRIEPQYQATKKRFAGHFGDSLPRSQILPFWRALCATSEHFGKLTYETVGITASLYKKLQAENRAMADNQTNNQLLASAVLTAGQTRNLPFWRFVCLPRTTFTAEENTFSHWNVDTGRKIYDTLTPVLDRDNDVVRTVSELGINTKLIYMVDDLEAPLTRIQLRPPKKSFLSLPKGEQEKGVQQLATVRERTRGRIEGTVNNRFPFEVRFISEMVDSFDEFAELVEAQTMFIDPQTGVVKEDSDFVGKINRDYSDRDRTMVATRRVAQYGVEGSIIGETLPDGAIFLDSEPPVQVVWQKLTSLNKAIPTLFYATDADIRGS